ncbi:MAG: CinA family protein [Ruminococcus sp.]|nr:CinA family protein [Ruminococcus sp.]
MQYFLMDEIQICRIYKDIEKTLDKTLAHIVQWLDREGQTVATAESCTGGMLSQLLTSVPGASNVFELGICTYAERMKTQLLGVPAKLISDYGVVSAQVAKAMAEGLQRQSEAELCLSVTGIAGPDGGTTQQPVGTVYAGILWNGRMTVAHLQLWQYGLQTREEIRRGTAVCVFGIAECFLMEEAACRKKKNLR